MLEDCAVDTEDVTGDHGRDDAIELRETLRLYVGYSGGTGGISSECRYAPVREGRRGEDLRVADRSSDSTLVELFQAGLLLSVEFTSSRSSFCADGDDSGVRLCECLWEGVTGVGGWLPMKCSIDARCLSVRTGSEDGIRDGLLVAAGVAGPGDFACPLNFRASLRNGEIDRDNALLLCVRSFIG